MLAYVISALSNWLYTYILVALLLAAGLYFTLRTRFVQLRMFGESFRVLREEKHEEGGVSSFQALMISTASRVGTGNIAGVSIAICLGGVGAVFWMWLVALLGGASAFIESTLAQLYKVPDGNGGSRGGPAYYIEKVLGSRGLALLFSVFLILTYMVGFNMVASYNLMDAFSGYSFFSPTTTPTVVGVVLAVLTALCIMGGSQRLSRVTGVLVPVMGGIYVLAALVMIVLHALPRLSVYGVSVGGAAAHNCGQVAAAMLTLGSAAPLAYLPFLLLVSVFTGALTGFVAALLFRAMRHARAK